MKAAKLITLFLFLSLLAFSQTDPLESIRKKIAAKDYAGAKADLTKLIESNPKNKAAYSLRGRARMGLQDFYGAIGDFNFALEIDSMFTEALNFRGESKTSLGDDGGAILDLNKTIDFNPKFTEAYINRGFAKYNIDDLQGAYFDFSKALELGPADADKYFNRGVVKAELGEFVRIVPLRSLEFLKRWFHEACRSIFPTKSQGRKDGDRGLTVLGRVVRVCRYG